MDGFFEKYGRMIIVAVAICFVLLYLTPMRNVVGSSINGFVGNFANKVGESLGTVKMPDGSGNVAKEKSSMIIGSKKDFNSRVYSPFADIIPEQATTVVFTDEVAPEGAATTDLTVAKDGDVVGWLDGTTWKVSTQDSNKAVTLNENCAWLFQSENGYGYNKLSKLTNISFDNVDTSKVTNMIGMFAYCSSLTSLDLSNFDTSNVTSMYSMFNNCGNLKELDLSSFDTSQVTSMHCMFKYCKNITNIYVGPMWSTNNIEDNSVEIFGNCKNLPNFDASTLDVTNAHAGPGGYLTLKA